VILGPADEGNAAVRLEPGFASAWARLAIVRGLQTQYGTAQPLADDSLLALGRAAADRALALDSADADAWLALGLWNAIKPDPGAAWLALTRAEQRRRPPNPAAGTRDERPLTVQPTHALLL